MNQRGDNSLSEMNSTEGNENKSSSPFLSQFSQFCNELCETIPELSLKIKEISEKSTKNELMKFYNSLFAELRKNTEAENTNWRPEYLLPNLNMPDDIWESLSHSTKLAILEYIRVLGMCAFFECDEMSVEAQDEWQNMIGNAVETVDFEKITEFFKNFIEKISKKQEPESTPESVQQSKQEQARTPNLSTFTQSSSSENKDKTPFSAFPKLPEKFLKGHLAKLAEELVRDIRPEDLGLTPELIQEIEESPSRAFDLLIQVFTRNPKTFQNTFQRIGKKLQQKVATGQIKPQEIAREAEELMKEFAGNSDFMEMMEGLKSVFGMEDMNFAKKAGQEGSARLAAVKARLNKKKEAKAAAAAATTITAAAVNMGSYGSSPNQLVQHPSLDELVNQIEGSSTKDSSQRANKNKSQTKSKKKYR